VVGPETPLVAGIVDDLAGAGIKAFGPGKLAAQLEGSKGFTKALCTECGIPTGAYRPFTSAADALAYVRAQGAPLVVKADGLAAGKGVVRIDVSGTSSLVTVTNEWLEKADANLPSLVHVLREAGVAKAVLLLSNAEPAGVVDVVSGKVTGLAKPRPPPPQK